MLFFDLQAIGNKLLTVRKRTGMTQAKVAEMLADDEDGELKLVVYDKKKKGFYVWQRKYDLTDILLALHLPLDLTL